MPVRSLVRAELGSCRRRPKGVGWLELALLPEARPKARTLSTRYGARDVGAQANRIRRQGQLFAAQCYGRQRRMRVTSRAVRGALEGRRRTSQAADARRSTFAVRATRSGSATASYERGVTFARHDRASLCQARCRRASKAFLEGSRSSLSGRRCRRRMAPWLASFRGVPTTSGSSRTSCARSASAPRFRRPRRSGQEVNAEREARETHGSRMSIRTRLQRQGPTHGGTSRSAA